VTAATLEVSRDGKRLGVLTTEKRQHVDALGGRRSSRPPRSASGAISAKISTSFSAAW